MSSPTTGKGYTFEEAIANAIANRRAAGFSPDEVVSIISHSVSYVEFDGKRRLWHEVDTVRRR